jgi:hypothetical protein
MAAIESNKLLRTKSFSSLIGAGIDEDTLSISREIMKAGKIFLR